MKVVKILAWIIGILLVLFVILMLVAPVNMHVERTVAIKAPAPVVWEHIVKFEKFNEWNTWRKADPAAQYTTSGEDGTVGAVNSWKGEKIGEGKLEHLALDPYTSIRQRLTFIKPWESEAAVFFKLEEAGGNTHVTWGFDAAYPRPMNVMGLFMEGALEKDFDEGLNNLKKIAEADTTQPGQ